MTILNGPIGALNTTKLLFTVKPSIDRCHNKLKCSCESKQNLINWPSLSTIWTMFALILTLLGCLALKFKQAKNKMFHFLSHDKNPDNSYLASYDLWGWQPVCKSNQIAAKVAFPCWLNTLYLLWGGQK